MHICIAELYLRINLKAASYKTNYHYYTQCSFII